MNEPKNKMFTVAVTYEVERALSVEAKSEQEAKDAACNALRAQYLGEDAMEPDDLVQRLSIKSVEAEEA